MHLSVTGRSALGGAHSLGPDGGKHLERWRRGTTGLKEGIACVAAGASAWKWEYMFSTGRTGGLG